MYLEKCHMIACYLVLRNQVGKSINQFTHLNIKINTPTDESIMSIYRDLLYYLYSIIEINKTTNIIQVILTTINQTGYLCDIANKLLLAIQRLLLESNLKRFLIKEVLP